MRRAAGKMGVHSETWPSGKKEQIITLSHHVLRNRVFRRNLTLTVQGKQQRCRARNGEEGKRSHSSCWQRFCKALLSVEKWMDGVQRLTFALSKLVQSSGFLTFTTADELALPSLFCLVGFLPALFPFGIGAWATSGLDLARLTAWQWQHFPA